MGQSSLFISDVEQVGRLEAGDQLVIARGFHDANVEDPPSPRPADFPPLGLGMDCGVELDSQRVIEAERAEVTAIDPPGVPPGRDPVPGPLGRRIPVGDVVMLVRVIDPARGRLDHPILHPDRVAALQGRRRRILACRRAPRSELVKHSGAVPLSRRDGRFRIVRCSTEPRRSRPPVPRGGCETSVDRETDRPIPAAQRPANSLKAPGRSGSGPDARAEHADSSEACS